MPLLEDYNLDELGLIEKLVSSNKSYHAKLDTNESSVVRLIINWLN